MLRIYEPNDLSIAEQALSHSEMSEFSSTDSTTFLCSCIDCSDHVYQRCP